MKNCSPATIGFVFIFILFVFGLGGCARHRPPLSVPLQPIQEFPTQEECLIPEGVPIQCPKLVVSSKFGEPRENGRLHQGIDFAVPCGTAVHATADGVTTFTGTKHGYGKTVVLKHHGEYETLYAHLIDICTYIGEHVKRGARIGFSGATGNASGPHLHYEIRKNGVSVNPKKYLNRKFVEK